MKKILYLMIFVSSVAQCGFRSTIYGWCCTIKDGFSYIYHAGYNKGKLDTIEKVVEIGKATTSLTDAPIPNPEDVKTLTNILLDATAKTVNALNGVKESVEHTGKIVGSKLGTMSDEMTVGNILATANITITLGKVSYYTLSYIKSKVAPSDAERLEKEKIKSELQIRATQKSLNECLAKHANNERNAQGIPTECEKVAQFFAQVAGYSKLNNEIDEFKKFTKPA